MRCGVCNAALDWSDPGLIRKCTERVHQRRHRGDHAQRQRHGAYSGSNSRAEASRAVEPVTDVVHPLILARESPCVDGAKAARGGACGRTSGAREHRMAAQQGSAGRPVFVHPAVVYSSLVQERVERHGGTRAQLTLLASDTGYGLLSMAGAGRPCRTW